MPVRLPVALAAVIVALLLAPAAHATTETAAGGQVTATFSYTKRVRQGFAQYSDLRITIVRAGTLLFDGPVTCRYCEGADPAGQGLTPSIRVRDLDGDAEPEVLLDLYTGGAHCCSVLGVYRLASDAGHYIPGFTNFGDPGYVIRDLDGDGKPELRTADDHFAYKYTSYVESGLPLLIYDYRAGALVNVTRHFKGRVLRDARRWLRYAHQLARQRDGDVRGFLAAYVADEYTAGHGSRGVREVRRAIRHHLIDKGPHTHSIGPYRAAYLRSLLRFLHRLGYR
jgi:hypothetical protein